MSRTQAHGTEVTGWEASAGNPPQTNPHGRDTTCVCSVGQALVGALDHCDSGEVTQGKGFATIWNVKHTFRMLAPYANSGGENRSQRWRLWNRVLGGTGYPNPPGVLSPHTSNSKNTNPSLPPKYCGCNKDSN